MLKYFINPKNQTLNPKKPNFGGYSKNPNIEYEIITHKVSCVVRHFIGEPNVPVDVYVFSNYEDEFLVINSAVDFLNKIFESVRFVSLKSYADNYMQLDN